MELPLTAQFQTHLSAVYDLLDIDNHPTLQETCAWHPDLGSRNCAGPKCEAVAVCLACMMHPHSLSRLCQRGLSVARACSLPLLAFRARALGLLSVVGDLLDTCNLAHPARDHRLAEGSCTCSYALPRDVAAWLHALAT